MKAWFKKVAVRVALKVVYGAYSIFFALHGTAVDVAEGFKEAEKALWDTLVSLQTELK